nr:MAG: hypothetical protein DIU57_00570 [Pseudomonadota bacterium]
MIGRKSDPLEIAPALNTSAFPANHREAIDCCDRGLELEPPICAGDTAHQAVEFTKMLQV